MQNSVTWYKRFSCQIWYPSLAPVSRYWTKLWRFFFFDFRISGESLITRDYHNSRSSDDIDMKLGSVTKFHKRKETKSKKFDDNFMSEIVKSLSFFQFTANLEQSGSRIPDAYLVKLIFWLIITFYLSKTESRTKKSLTQLSHYCFQ